MQIAFADRSNCLGEPVASAASPRSEANQWRVGSQWGASGELQRMTPLQGKVHWRVTSNDQPRLAIAPLEFTPIAGFPCSIIPCRDAPVGAGAHRRQSREEPHRPLSSSSSPCAHLEVPYSSCRSRD